MSLPLNVYVVWTDSDGSYEADYYLLIAARTHSHAKYLYASFGGWQGEYFDKAPDGFHFHCHLVEKNAPYEHCGEVWRYEETRGVDLIMEGILQPMWRVNCGYEEHDYWRWDGFRKPKPSEMEVTGESESTTP